MNREVQLHFNFEKVEDKQTFILEITNLVPLHEQIPCQVENSSHKMAVGALKWYISIVEGMFGQKYLPYFFNLFYMELFSLALPIIPFTGMFIAFAIAHKIVEKVTDSTNIGVKALKFMRNLFFIIVSLCFGLLLAMVMGTLFVFANDYYYLVVIYSFLGVIAVNIYFVICYAIFVRFMCQSETKTPERQYYHDSDNSFYESEIESLVERTPTDETPQSKASFVFVALGTSIDCMLLFLVLTGIGFVFLILFATALMVVFTGVCVSFAPNHFSTALTRAIAPKNALYCQDRCAIILRVAILFVSLPVPSLAPCTLRWLKPLMK